MDSSSSQNMLAVEELVAKYGILSPRDGGQEYAKVMKLYFL